MNRLTRAGRWLVAATLILIAAVGVGDRFSQDMDLVPGGTFNGHMLLAGVGSGAFHDLDGHPGDVWTITDRGANGDHPSGSNKVFPVPSFTPTIYRLRIRQGGYEVLDTIPIQDKNGHPITGLPPASVPPLASELAYLGDNDSAGPFTVLPPDPEGLDTEALVRLKSGSFWIGEETAGLVHVAKNGRILRRIVPQGTLASFAGADYPVEDSLPAILARRRLNRGIEAIAVSRDEKHLYIIYQNPLDNPLTPTATRNIARDNGHVRLFKLRLTGNSVTPVGEWVYKLDAGSSFGRALVPGPGFVGDDPASRTRDVKISELVNVGEDKLVILERLEKTTKLYLINLNDGATDILGRTGTA